MLSRKGSQRNIGIVITFILMEQLLSGCAQYLELCPIIYDVPDHLQATPESKYYHQIFVDGVTGGDETFCHPGTVLSDAVLKRGMVETLKRGEFFNGSPSATYIMSLKLISIQQISEGTFQKATVIMKASLKNRLTGRIVFKDIYESTFAAPHNAAILAMERIRMATETAAEQNIEKIIGRLEVSVPYRPATPVLKSEGASNMKETDLL